MLPLQNLYYRFWSGNIHIGFLAVLGGVVNVAAPKFIPSVADEGFGIYLYIPVRTSTLDTRVWLKTWIARDRLAKMETEETEAFSEHEAREARENMLRRRNERDRARRASETPEEREKRLSRRRERERAMRASHSAEATETAEQREQRLSRRRDRERARRASHSAEARYVDRYVCVHRSLLCYFFAIASHCQCFHYVATKPH